MDKLKALFSSRKFWGALVALVIVFTGDRAGLTPTQIFDAVVVLISFITGTALENVASAVREPKG